MLARWHWQATRCDDECMKRALSIVIFAVAAWCATQSGHAVLAGPASVGSEATVPEAVPTTTIDNDFLDTEKNLDDCIGNFNPKPGCGTEPQESGDRGGTMQYAVFATMAAGLSFIGWRVTRSVKARDKAMATSVTTQGR